MFQRAIELDPTYAAAYAALGGTYFDAVVSGWTEFRDEEVARAEALAQKALALDPGTTSAHRLPAATHLYRGHHDLALGQIDRALEINPSDAESYAYRGYILVYAGKSGEALPWLEAALRFDRANTRASMYVGTAYYFLNRYDKAIDACDRTLARNPGRSTQLNAHAILAASYAAIGKDQNAEGERAMVARLAPFFSAERFAAQFVTPEARDHMLEGLKKAGFR
jgi:adenylate cyclase